MSDGDVRKEFLLNTVANYFGLSTSDRSVSELGAARELNNFLDDGNSTLLSANIQKLEDGGTKIHLDNATVVGLSENKVVVFFKSRPDVVTPENLHQVVLVSSMLDSPVSALYHALQKVYSPLLLKDAKWSNEFDPKLQSLITELEKGLGSVIRRRDPNTQSGGGGGDAGDAFDAMASILTPMDETQYWADVANTAKKKDQREKASAFWNTMEPVANDFNKIGTMQLQDAQEVIETSNACLDDLWKLDDWLYPQRRMVHLMDIIAHALTRFIQAKCGTLDLWKAPYTKIEETLRQGIELCEKWTDSCQKLTSIYWPNYTPHLWEGAPYTPDHSLNVQRRLGEILSIRALHKQLTQLLSNAEQEELKTSKSFEPFQELNPVQYNPYTESQWRAAVSQFQNALVPAENRIAGKLKSQLRNMNANTLQFLQEFKRYQELIRRPSIQRELVVERENLLAMLSDYISAERKSFRETGPNKHLHGVPTVINNIYFVRQMHAKVEDIMKTGEQLLSDLDSWRKLKSESGEFLEEMMEYQREQFNSWTRENLHDVEGKHLSLQTTSQVVYFEAGKDMKVSYNPRLVGLMREVRMLTLLGFAIPHKIQQTADLAKKFSTQAKMLDQIAGFHNTIGDRMITSQRPMMLDAALGLAQLVKEQTDMTWENSDQVQHYIEKLKQHVDKLARQNNRLAAYHKQVRQKVLILMDTDLLRQQNKWKEILKEIRQIMSNVEQEGFTNLKTWRNHWDRQLYKTLEHQYQVGLEALNEHLPEIKLSLVYRNQRLRFDPPIEEIRMKYFSQLKRFLAIPKHFRGVSESAENLAFPAIIDRNAHRFSHLFRKAEDLFRRLEAVKERFVDWVALGNLDIEESIRDNCQEPEDWERNFRASKARGQEIGRLPSGEERIDCLSVSFAPVRMEVEVLNRRYWDALESTLHRSIVEDVHAVETFAIDAMETLKKQPQSVEEIGEANQKHREFEERTDALLQRFNRAEKKNRVLAAWTKESVDQVGRVAGVWDNYITLMDNHELIISKQVEAIKANLNTQVTNLNGDIEKFKLRWDQLKPKDDSTAEGADQAKMLQGLQTIKEKQREWAELMQTRDKIFSDCAHFGLSPPELPHEKEVREDLERTAETWGLLEEFQTGLREMANEEWIIFRSKSFRFEEFLGSWYERLNSSKQATTVTVRLLREIERHKVILPVLKYVRGDIFSDAHWSEMFSLLGMPHKPVDKLLFADFLTARDALAAKEEDLKELNNRAVGEVAIRQALNELDIWEVEAKFTFLEHQASTGEKVPLIKDWKDVLSKVGDNQVLLQSIKGSSFYNAFGSRASVWETKLADLDEILNNLNTAQRKWVYLEPYQEQMKLKSPSQTGGFDYREVFRKIDDDFRMIMRDAERDNRVVSLLKIGSVKSILTNMLERLERCQKSLNEFLEEKRSSFPRFYFIGDDDLLQILGQATKPAIIQTHLKKLFAGIHNVNFDEEERHIVSMNSLEGEVVPLRNHVRITPQVETWLSELAKEMKNTLRQLLADCVAEGRKEATDPLKYPSQVLCVAEEILFTERCEEAIKRTSLKSLLKDLNTQLESFTSVDLGDDADAKVLDLKLKALVLDTIHHIEVTKALVEGGVKSSDDWLWQKQLRYYLDGEKGSAKVVMVDASFEYTYEYQGNAPKLVHTPLTDKCYLTLTQGMRVGLGGNPYGPAGTGKTESVKALGGLLGRQVLVFNCDEGIDVKSMGRIFIGLVKCGAWGCFDEFNRLEEQTLSAVSMQIQPIQTALKNKAKEVMLLDKQVSLDANSGIFVTMNPAGKGYGGRQKLPDNLKQLFRPVAMSRPDNELIGEVTLYAEGFKDAKSLGQKLVGIFSMSRRLLSPQQHYDWGLRALKTVLKGCGGLLKQAKRADNAVIDSGREAEIAVQALRLNTLSKLTFADSLRFDALVKDVFSGVTFQNSGYEELKEALKESCAELGFYENEGQLKKAVELFEQLQQRMGVVIVGPSGSGKTTLFTLLKHALHKLGSTVKQHTMNPKALPRTQLLGSIDLDTREWTNGVLTVAALAAVDEPADVNTWIVSDGDIDPEWVESLNSVLDDNRLLTLPSGWRIQFGPNVNFLFETHDLSFASPATISRVGMIFLSDEDTDVKGLVHAWVAKQDENAKEVLIQYMDQYFFRALDWCQKQSDYVVETSLVGTVLNGLSHMQGVSNRLEFAVALVRGMGGNLNDSAKETFAREVFGWVGETPPGRKPHLTFYNRERDRIDVYAAESINDLSLDAFNDPSTLPLVRTAVVKAALDCLMSWLEAETKPPFLLLGPEGCGKSLLLKHCFRKLRSTNVATVHCSANISPQHVIQKLSQMCLSVSSSNGKVLRPKECDRLILYLKDINLAKPDKYGTCMLVAFLQQIITYRGFYDNNLEWVGLEAIQIVGSITAGSGLGRHQLNTRFTSVVRILSLSEPDSEHLETVYAAYVGAVLRKICPSHPVQARSPQLAASMVSVFQQLKQTFSVDERSHYVFTARHLTEWTLGLARYSVEDNATSAVLGPWAHEACRLFRDKMSSADDEVKFEEILSGALRADWNVSLTDLGDQFYVTGSGGGTVGGPLPRFGRPIGSLGRSEWAQLVDKGITAFSREYRELDVVVVDELLWLVAACDRVLSAPGGSLLLAGRAGIGRRSAVGVAAAMHRAKYVELKMSKGFGVKQFRAELKGVMQAAGVEGEQVVLLLEDHNLEDSLFLDMVNSLLSSGEIPGLYTPEEMEALLTPLKERAANEGFSGNLLSYYARAVHQNLHVAIVMDCTATEFKANCESNPALYKECQVVWRERWSEKTLSELPKLILTKEERVEGDDIGQKKHKQERRVSGGEELLRNFSAIQRTIGEDENSPLKFVSLIQTYASVYTREKAEILARQQKLTKGVTKLTEAHEVVHKLKAEAAEQEKALAEKQNEANEALQMITDTMRNANVQKGEMEDLRGQTLQEERNLNERKKEIDVEMAEIQPLVEEAKKAVGNIKSTTLSEIRSLRAPPEVIRDILEGVLRLMGTQDTSWNSMKNFLAKRGVKDEILSFDARRITPKNRQIVETLLEEKSNSFDPAVAKRASGAAAPLASWVLANVKFSYVLEKVKPLEAEQAKLQRNLKMAEDQIGSLSSGLSEVDKQVAVLKERLNKFTKEAAEVEIHLNKTKETIAAADSLVEGLEGEYERWNADVSTMEEDLAKIPQFSLLGAAFLVYLSNAPEDLRRERMDAWRTLLGIKRFDLNHFLSSEREILQWRSEGLPSDNVSVENALCIMQSLQSPYLVDPSSRASDWLKTNLGSEESAIEVTTQDDDRFVLTLELAIRFGKTLIVQEADRIDPVLYPVLRRDLSGAGPYRVVQVGEKQVDFNPSFRLFLTTRNTTPNIAPGASAVVAVVNFTTTMSGLTGQLLAEALLHEKPELEQRKSDLLKKEEENKIEISKLEDFLLEQLANSSGNILENKELLASLNETKDKSAHIAESLKESLALQEKLEEEGNVYLPIAEFASRVYFAVLDLVKMNNMYRVSLAAFLRLFHASLTGAAHGGSAGERRTEAIKATLLTKAYQYVARSLFKSDRLAFAMHMAHKMRPELFAPHEWEAFVGVLVDAALGAGADVAPRWAEEERRQAAAKLRSNFPELFNVGQLDDGSVWSTFANAEECEQEFPLQMQKKLSEFQQVLIVQTFRPDRLVSAMEQFAVSALALQDLSPPTLSLGDILSETTSTEPVLVVISSGSDPSEELRELASSQRVTLHEVAMGQGQTDVALERLATAAKSGEWLMLKNLHLMTFWVPVLAKEVARLEAHEKFRLWLTAESHPKFPAVMSEHSLKVTYEAPPGIKRNLQRTLRSWGPDVFAGASAARAQNVFALAWFHAVAQERRKFIPQGWCKFYEFSDGDLRAGLELVQRLHDRGNVDWNTVHGLCENAIYGGRVDDAHDIKILRAYLERVFNSAALPGAGRVTQPLGPFELPADGDYRAFATLADSLADEDKPSMFGLPANIERSYQRSSSGETVVQLRALMRTITGAQTFERDKWQKELTPILNLWKKLNQGSALLKAKLQAPPASVDADPIKAFAELEYFNAVALLQLVHASLSGLSKVIRGTAHLDETVAALADSLLRHETPGRWQKAWDGPEDPLEYVQTLCHKADRVQQWHDLARQDALLRGDLTLSDLFHPDTFLGALRQLTSRQYGTAMDELRLVNAWSQGGLSGAKLVVRVTGLMLEGATFDGQRLSASAHDAPTFSVAPTCTLAWIPKEDDRKSGSQHTSLSLPLYFSNERERVVGHLQLPSNGETDKWLLSGTVLFINNYF